ncbi:MAG TPA: DUF4199 domain-containing protein [Puia sp.]|nr:DUF4199 domain-containing protein [Puia sp.]
MKKKITTPVLAGLILSLIVIVSSLVTYFTGIYVESWGYYIGLGILTAGILWAVLNHAREKESNVTYGQLFAFGFKVAAVVACITILYTLLSGMIFPDMKEKILEISRQRALAKPGMTPEMVDQSMEMFENHYTLWIVAGIIFFDLFVGVVASLIAAAIPKKNPISPFDE